MIGVLGQHRPALVPDLLAEHRQPGILQSRRSESLNPSSGNLLQFPEWYWGIARGAVRHLEVPLLGQPAAGT